MSCEELVRQLLSDGNWHDAKEISATVKSHGFKKSEFKSVRKELRVTTRNNADGTWSWRL